VPLIHFYDLQYEAIRLNPKDADARYGKGLALKNQEKYDEAIKAYGEAIRARSFL
jgi:tetratricopeptide (TPR) repeat protein